MKMRVLRYYWKENTCLGILAKKEEIFAIKSKFTVLATGGLGGIYKNTTNFSHIKGDGVAVAIRHNIELRIFHIYRYIQQHCIAKKIKGNF